jgi:5-methylcytosine-specific restriction endonuclease McrA
VDNLHNLSQQKRDKNDNLGSGVFILERTMLIQEQKFESTNDPKASRLLSSQILRLDKAGTPISWINLEEAACLYTKELILWSIGEPRLVIRGGYNRITQKQSILTFAPVIAVDGTIHSSNHHVPSLTNSLLFARDHFICMYCGEKFSRSKLTRDHVIPKGQGGKDSWENCVTACLPCNHRKGCRTPEQAGMTLLAVPYKPNKYEYLALANRNILVDQMMFLEKGFSHRSQFL